MAISEIPRDAAGLVVNAIEQAVDGYGLELHFQPIVSLGIDKHTSFEVLARLRAQDGLLLMPSAFLPEAARRGLMPMLDQAIFLAALERLSEASGQTPDLRFFVNLSEYSLRNPSDMTALLDVIYQQRPEQGSLVVEIDKTAVRAHPKRAKAFGDTMTRLGYSVALDGIDLRDNGVNYHRHMQIEFVKIHKSLIQNIEESRDRQAQVRAITDRAHQRGHACMVNAAETVRSLASLYQAGVDYVQGFGICAPTADLVQAVGHHELASPH